MLENSNHQLFWAGFLPDNLNLTSFWATVLIFMAVVAGHLYKQNWKMEGPAWKAWLYGAISGGSLLALGFIPLKLGT